MYAYYLHPKSNRIFEKYSKAKEPIRVGNYIYDGNVAFFKGLQIMGMFPLTMTSNGTLKLQYGSAVGVHTIFLIVLNVFFTIYVMFQVYLFFKRGEYTFESGVTYVSMLLCAFIRNIPLIELLEARKLETFFQRCNRLQADFERVADHKMIRYSQKKSDLFIIMNVVVIAIIILVGGLKLLSEITGIYADLFGILIVNGTNYALGFLLGMVMLWRMLNNGLKHFAECLICDIELCRWRFSNNLKDHFKLWLALREQCSDLADAMCWTYLHMCSFVFLITLSNLFVGVSGIPTGENLMLLPVVATILFITVIVDMAHRTVKKVGVHFESRITRLMLSGRAVGGEEALDWFLKSMQTNQPSMSFGEFFNLDRALHISLYSTIITYVIIIVQFRTGATPAKE